MVADFQKQPDHTYTVSTFGNQISVPGFSARVGNFIQYDSLGNVLRTWVASSDSLATNMHELRVLDDESAVLFGYVTKTVDMRQFVDGGDPHATVYGSQLEHLAPDGGVLWKWNELDYIPLSQIDPAVLQTEANVDAFHSNAIDFSDGGFLISNRDMSEIVKVDSTTNAIVWTLGGLGSDFVFVNDPLNGPSFQHGARELPNGDIICFDNGDGRTPLHSRAVEYALDPQERTATLVWEGDRSPAVYSASYGFAQRLVNGNTLVTYGDDFLVDEIAPDGGVVWELSDQMRTELPDGGSVRTDTGIYRAFRIPSLY
jgi:hypothetical protein